MFCSNCGNEIGRDDRFCKICGTANQAQGGAAEKNGFADKGRKKIITWLACAGIAAVLVIAVVLSIGSGHKVDLKYDWGTDFDEIISKEGDAVYSSDRDRYQYDHIKAYDERHKIDRLKEFDIRDEGVQYVLRAGELLRCRYYFINDYSGEEVVEIISGYYGNNYYDRGTEYIWWEDGTVVRVDMYDNSISYYDEIDYLEAHDSYYERYASQDILEYFGKERYEEQ